MKPANILHLSASVVIAWLTISCRSNDQTGSSHREHFYCYHCSHYHPFHHDHYYVYSERYYYQPRPAGPSVVVEPPGLPPFSPPSPIRPRDPLRKFRL
jgi:hypothetical protein